MKLKPLFFLPLTFLFCVSSTFAQISWPKGSMSGPTLVASLPTIGNSNLLYDVRDASTSTTCATGGGTFRVICHWTGAAYERVAAGASVGDVAGPASSTDNAAVRFDSTTGKLIQNSGVIIDDNNNVLASNISPGFATTVTVAGTTTLTVASKGVQAFTGSTTQTVTLPVVTTLPQTGFGFVVQNDSSGVVTVNSSGGNAVQVMAAASRATFTCTLLTGTTAASWNVTYYGLDGLTVGTTAVASGTATRVLFEGAGNVLSEDSDLTFLTDTLTATKIVGSTSITDTGLTAGRVTFAGAAGLLSDDADMTFATDTLTATKLSTALVTNAGGLSLTTTAGNGSVTVSPNGTGVFIAPNGTISNLGISFGANDGQYGLYKAAAGIGLMSGGNLLTFWNSGTGQTVINSTFGLTFANGNPNGTADTGITRNAAAVIEINNGTAGSLGALKATTATFSTVAADTATADSTACIRASDGLLLKGTGTLGICLGTSSARFKNHIQGFSNRGLSEVLALHPKQFFYNKGYGDNGVRLQFGFLAEDVVKVMPELVGLDNNSDPNSVDILGMIPRAIIPGIQELNAKFDAMTVRLTSLEKENRRLRRLLRHRRSQ